MTEASSRQRASSISAIASRRGQQVTAPFHGRIHGYQIRAAFIRGRLGSDRQVPEITSAIRKDLGCLIDEVADLSSCFENAVLADGDNSRVLEVRKALQRMTEQLAQMQIDPRAGDASVFSHPASLAGNGR